MQINKAWAFKERQEYTYEDRVYDVHACVSLSTDLPIIELKLADVYIGYDAPCKNSLRSFVSHMKMVNDADLECPILLNESNVIIDGRHRLIKALIEGRETIKARRFAEDPEAGYRVAT